MNIFPARKNRLISLLLCLSLLLTLAACGSGGRGAGGSASSPEPSGGGGMVASKEPGESAPAAPESESAPSAPENSGGSDHASSEPEQQPSAPSDQGEKAPGDEAESGTAFTVGIEDLDGNPQEGTVDFSIRFPDTWTASGNVISTDEGYEIAEVMPCIPFADESIFDRLAEKYPDGDPIQVTVGTLPGKYFYAQTPMQDPAFSSSFETHILYYLEYGDYLIGIKFNPAFGVGIGTQRENFQADIQSIR